MGGPRLSLSGFLLLLALFLALVGAAAPPALSVFPISDPNLAILQDAEFLRKSLRTVHPWLENNIFFIGGNVQCYTLNDNIAKLFYGFKEQNPNIKMGTATFLHLYPV